MAGEEGFGLFPGARLTPTWKPTPNSEPAGALTGAPIRTIFRSYQVIPASAVGVGGNEPTLIVPPTASNRLVIMLAPAVNFRIFIGDSGVTPKTGFALPVGQPYDAPLPGLQGLYAVTDAPVFLSLQVQISIILSAEQQRRVG